MFKALKLNPFSAPSDPRLTFKATSLPRLYASTISSEDDEYWSQFYQVFGNTYDVLNLLSVAELSKVLAAHPENIVTLVHKLADRLEDIISSSNFPTALDAHTFAQGIAAYRPTFLNGKQSQDGAPSTPDLTREALNCVRVLSRVIPLIFSHSDRGLEDSIFWQPRPRSTALSGRQQEPSQFIIDDEDEDEDTRGPPAAGQQNASTPPLAHTLIDIAVNLLFTYGFTIPRTADSGDKMVAYLIWENGIGSTQSLASSREIDSNRIDVLRFLLTMLSKTMFVPANAYTASLSFTGPSASSIESFNKWHAYFVQRPSSAKGRKATLSVLCSVLNVALKSGAAQAATSQSLVGTVGDAVGESYEKLLSGGKRKVDSPRLALVKTCVQLMSVVLCTVTPESLAEALQQEQQRRGGNVAARGLDTDSSTAIPQTPAVDQMTGFNLPASARQANAFSFFLSKLHRDSDLSFIVENILVVLLQPMRTSFLKMPLEVVGVGSSASPTMALDYLILLWKLLDCNPKLASHLVKMTEDAHRIAAVLVHSCLEHGTNPAQLALVKLSAFLLQTLSAEPAFGEALNKPFSGNIPLPSKYDVPGSAADFVIQHLYTLIFTTKGQLHSIYPAFVLTIDNISPYLKDPTVVTSTRLVQLFISISSPAFLLSDESNPRLVYYLLEAFNNIIKYQLNACPNLIYAIIRSHVRFEELANFTLGGGVEVIRRRRKLRQAGNTGHTSPKTSRRQSMASVRDETSSMTGTEMDFSEQVAQRIQDEEKASLAQRDVQASSPASEYPPILSPRRSISEKAAGKRRARSSSQSTYPPGSRNASHADLASLYASEAGDDEGPYISKSGFQPTESWVASWREGLPMDGILILVSECLSKISSLSSLSASTNSAAIEKYLRSVNLQDVLPPSPAVKPRPFQMSSLHSLLWVMSLSWGNVYVQSLENSGINGGLSNWRDTHIQLFNVRQAAGVGFPGGVGQMQAAMSSWVEQGMGMLSLGGGQAAARRAEGSSSPRRSMSRSSFGIV